jgi:hypothetical protein
MCNARLFLACSHDAVAVHLQNSYVGKRLLFAQFANEVLEILGVELRLFPGHEVTTTRKIGKVYKVYLARSPFTRQRRIVGTSCS